MTNKVTSEYEISEFGLFETNRKVETVFRGPHDTLVNNFSIHEHEKSCIRAHDRNVNGCKSTGSDIMLTFGSTISPRGGNNQVLETNYPTHIDVFINTKQAEDLIKELTKVLERNRGGL